MRKNAEFSKNVLIVSLGPIISSILSLLFEPVIARFWEPYVFGTISFFNSIVLVFSPMIFMRYNFAIVQAKDDEEKYNLLALSILVMLAFIILLSFVYPIITPHINSNFSFSQYQIFFFVSLIFAGLFTLFRFWSSSEKRFVQIALSVILLQASNTFLLVFGGIFGLTDSATGIYIRSISYISSPMLMIVVFFRKDIKKGIELIRFRAIVKVMKKYKKYPLVDFWGIWASNISFHVPTILIAKYWGQEINGLYSKAFVIVYLLVLFFGDAVNRVFHKEVADMVNNEQDISRFIINVISTLSQISILPFILLIIVGPELFSFFLGNVWLQSGYYAGAISFWMYTMLISTAIIPLYGVLNKQGQQTFFSLLMLFMRSSVLIYMGLKGTSGLNAVIVFSLLSMVLVTFQFSFIIKKAGVPLKILSKIIITPIVKTFPLIVIVLSVKHFLHLANLNILIITALLAIPYVYWFYYKHETINIMLKDIFSNIRLK